MNNDNLTTVSDQQTITSMEIAEITGRNHKDVMRSIRNMEPAWVNVTGRNFALCERTYEVGNGTKKKAPYYELNKKETLFVATKFNDEARAKLVIRWEELEKERLQALQPQQHSPSSLHTPPSTDDNLPVDPRNMSRLQILQMALAAEEENERLRAEKEELEADNYGLMLDIGYKDQEIAHLQERTAYLDVIDCQRDTVIVSQIAQDYGMSAVAFNNLLKGLRIQRKMGEQWILYADFLDKGYVANRMIPIHHAGRQDTFKPMTVWTQAGRKFLYQKLRDHGVLPLVERNMPAPQS